MKREFALDAQSWGRLEELLQAAGEVPATERRALLDRITGGDEALRAELESLLSYEDGAEALFTRWVPVVSAGLQEALTQSLLEEMQVALEGRYALERELGHGGMATVFLARDLRHDRRIALKVLHPELAAAVGGERLEREIQLTAQLNHPHILPLLDSGEIVLDGSPVSRIWYTMPYVSGDSLRHHLTREAPLPLSEAVRIAAEVADALDYAHRQGFVHLDIKPENILLQDGHALVADFGIARAIDPIGERAGAGIVRGTPAYMSPEHVAGEQNLDGRADVFSLGCVLYEMLAGRAPFFGMKRAADAEPQLTSDPPPLSAARPDAAVLEPLVIRAMARNAEDRFATARELRDALNAVQLGQHTNAVVSGWRHSPRSWLFAAAAVAVLLAAAWVLLPGIAPSPRAAASPTIAVLPLANRSADSADAALADGLTEVLIASLSRAGMSVTSSASAFVFRNHGSDLRAIADSLRVANILEGDVQKMGSRLLMNVRLIDARDSIRWSERYDREFADLYAVQTEIARSVAEALGIRPDGRARQQRSQTKSIAASELYVRALDPTLYRSNAGAREKLRLLQDAIALDSNFAAAYAQLASTYRRLGGRSELALAEEAALKAIALDDSLSEAHSALAAVRLTNDDFASAEEHLRIALELDPANPYTVVTLVALNTWLDRPDQALIVAEGARAKDPLSANTAGEVAHALLLNGRCDKALPLADTLAALPTPLLRAGVIAAQCYALQNKWQEAVIALRRAETNDSPRRQALIAYMLARAGDTAGARRIEQVLRERWQSTHEGAFSVAIVHAGLGDYDETFKWLDESFKDGSLASIIMEPLFKDVRRDSRFQQLMNRLKLPKR